MPLRTSMPTSVSEHSTPQVIRVLLVDDDEDDYILTRQMLRNSKLSRFHLEWANSFESGLVKISEMAAQEAEGYHVYLLDYHLGANTGLDLLGAIRTHSSKGGEEVPTIFLTGVGDASVDQAALDSGASDYLVKGQFTGDVLERSIRYALEQKRVLNALRHSEQVKETFVATLTHDLKTPIQSEYRVLELLQREHYGALNDTQHEVLQELLQSNQYLQQMVQNLLTTYQYQNGELTLACHPQSLHELIHTVVRECQVLLSQKNHQLQLQLDDTLPLLSLDTLAFRRVLTNLLQNALKFTSPGGRIEIQTQCHEESMTLSVSDNGPGMEPALQETIFQPYVSQARKFRQIGSGLGLYVSKQIVEEHGGTLTVNSVLEEGSTFTVMLPLLEKAILKEDSFLLG